MVESMTVYLLGKPSDLGFTVEYCRYTLDIV
jgi:hypothetical protein